jgi:2-oxoglutarate dehydrogenase complex dehydrogenase (E1) component-like enzyme
VYAFSTKIDSFLSGANSVYVEQMYEAWTEDPKRFVTFFCTSRVEYI